MLTIAGGIILAIFILAFIGEVITFLYISFLILFILGIGFLLYLGFSDLFHFSDIDLTSLYRISAAIIFVITLYKIITFISQYGSLRTAVGYLNVKLKKGTTLAEARERQLKLAEYEEIKNQIKAKNIEISEKIQKSSRIKKLSSCINDLNYYIRKFVGNREFSLILNEESEYIVSVFEGKDIAKITIDGDDTIKCEILINSHFISNNRNFSSLNSKNAAKRICDALVSLDS